MENISVFSVHKIQDQCTLTTIIFSIVFQTVADAHYKFIAADIGGFGKQSDCGTPQAPELHSVLTKRNLEIPDPSYLPNTNVKAPYVFVGMKPIHFHLSY